jgi:2-hydroxy-3-oxopropionate reductase
MERIGFIGLGIMGKPMAKNMMQAGFPLTVLDVNVSAVDELVAAGARAAGNLQQLAAQSEVIITMLPDTPELAEVVFGEQGIIHRVKVDTVFIDMSTVAPATSRKIYAAFKPLNVGVLDAPVSGGEAGAKNGTLSIMVGGDAAVFEQALPIFQVLGKNIVYMGEAGAGQVTKTCNQIIIGVGLQAVTEAFTLARKAGLDLHRLRQALLGGFAQSKVLEYHALRVIERNFQPGFKLKLHQKDLNISLETGRELQVPLPCTVVVVQQMTAVMAQQQGELDHTMIAPLLEKLAGMENI